LILVYKTISHVNKHPICTKGEEEEEEEEETNKQTNVRHTGTAK
jgi:hypothetical protein